MPTADSRVTRKEAATILGVSWRHVGNLVRQGRLMPIDRGFSGEDLFRVEEVYALLELKTRRLDLADTSNLAMQAHAMSRSTLDRLDKLCHLLGLTVNRLSYNEDSVHHLYMKATDRLQSNLSDIETGELMDWAATFQAIDESYLRVVADYTLSAEPWYVFMELAHQIILQQNTHESRDPNTTFAYNCVNVSRKHLRHVSYFYIRIRNGVDAAEVAVDDNEVDDEIIGQLYPAPIGPT